ncbi:MAG: hypothetical protein WCL14_07040 [Bacteroidota bacterium]
MKNPIIKEIQKSIQQTISSHLGKNLNEKPSTYIIATHIYESGHSINIANFKLQYDKNIGFGAAYVPSNALIKSPAMLIRHGLAKAANDSVGNIFADGKVPLAARLELFEPLSKLVTRCLGSLDATEALPQLKKNAKTLADVIRGFHHGTPTPPPTPGPSTPDTISTSHMSFVNRENNFRTFIALLSDIPQYTPAEADLTIIALNTLLDQMADANTNIGNLVVTPIENARTLRNHLIYDANIGLIDLALKSKKYVKSVFGADSPEFALVSKVKYKRYKQ